MLTKIWLKHFKCFSEAEIPLTPLTLLTGLNGSGKSSCMQSLLLLLQSHRSGALEKGRLLLHGEFWERGVARDFFSHGANDETLGISLAWDGEWAHWKFTYPEKRGSTDDFFALEGVGLSPSSPLFEKRFHYLQAERWGPRIVYDASNQTVLDAQTLGNRGEYAAHFLFEHQDREVHETLRHPSAGHKLLQQVESWIGDICPGTRLHVERLYEVGLVGLRYSTSLDRAAFDKVRPPHTGFGVSHVLPILLTLLCASSEDVVLLENPEAHLHPQGQRLMGYLLGLAAASGAQIIVETHSDQILSGVRLAVLAKKLAEEKATQLLFEKKPKGDVLESMVSSRKVGAAKFIDTGLAGLFEGWAEREADVSERSAILQEAWRLGDTRSQEAVKIRDPKEDWQASEFLDEMRIAWESERLDVLKKLLEEGLRRFPQDADLLHWDRLVAPATFQTRQSTEAEQQNRAWLEKHREDEQYKGHWVALLNGECLDKDLSLRALRKRVERGQGVFFVEVKP